MHENVLSSPFKRKLLCKTPCVCARVCVNITVHNLIAFETKTCVCVLTCCDESYHSAVGSTPDVILLFSA